MSYLFNGKKITGKRWISQVRRIAVPLEKIRVTGRMMKIVIQAYN